MNEALEFIVHGNPAPKGSLKCVGTRGARAHVLVENNPRTAVWRKAVRHAAAQMAPPFRFTGAVRVEMSSTLPRPAAHYRTGKYSHLLRATAPEFPIGRNTGDSDKFARLVLDALEDAGVFIDDAQVIEVVSRKAYVNGRGGGMDAPGVIIRVQPIGD